MAAAKTGVVPGGEPRGGHVCERGRGPLAARVAAQMISSPPTRVPARVRALLRRHVAIVSR